MLVCGKISVSGLIGFPTFLFVREWFLLKGMEECSAQCHACWQGAHMAQALNVHVMHVTVHGSMKPKCTQHDSCVFVPNVWQQLVSYFNQA